MSKTLCKQHHDDTDDGYYGGTIQNTTVSVVVNPDNHGLLFDLWQDFSLKDASFHDSVVGTVGFAVFRGMADGISSDGEDAVDELLVLVIVWQVQVHPVNRTHNPVSPLAPFFHRWTLLRIGFAFLCHDSAIQASLMALAAPSVGTTNESIQ